MMEKLIRPRIIKIKSQVVCPVELALRVLGGKWRGSILYQLRLGSLRFNHLKYNVQAAVVDYEDSDNFLSNKVLSCHLIELIEKDKKKKEKVDSIIYYSLTKKGESAMPILLDLFEWGETHF
ncbi:MAG: winged helix-turn-helix transcriptional regulator [Bacteroidia bacterium]